MVRENIHSDGGGVTLRRKSILIVTGTALALLAAMYVAGRATILAAALRLERESVALDLSRLVGALETEADHLLSTVGDWSTWDDTYAFVRERGAAYAEENLTDDALRNLRVTSMLFLDGSGAIVAEKHQPPGDERGHALSAHVAADPAAFNRTAAVSGAGAGVRGVLPLAAGNLIIAARPVLRSDGSGPPAGTLLFARPLDIVTVARDVRVHHLEAALLPLADPRVPLPDPGQPPAGAAAPAVVSPRSFRVVSGFVPVADFRGRPALALELTQLRAIYVQGVRSLSYFVGALGLAVLCFAALVALLLERLVLSRLSRLSESVQGVAGAADLSRRVPVAGGDEIAALGAEVNGMLARLQAAHTELRRSRDELDERVRERTDELETSNAALRDQVRERIRAEDALRALKEELERQNRDLRTVDRMKDALIGDVSHELRTPVAKQAMQLELLRGELARRGLLEELARPLAVMDTALRRQQSVIRNIMTLSRLEAGGRGLCLAPVRLDELVAEALEDYREVLEGCGVAVTVAVPAVALHTDRELLWHVISNLLSNAVKYRRREGARVEVTRGPGGRPCPPARRRQRRRLHRGDPQRASSSGSTRRAPRSRGSALACTSSARCSSASAARSTIDSPGRDRGTVAEVVLPLRAP